LLDIDRQELQIKFQLEDWDYVFDKVYKISDFLISSKFKIKDKEVVNDIKQECAINFYKKILDNKVRPDKNLFSFIWQNSTFRILEILRKERKRNEIARFVSYENMEYELSREEALV
jgi:hypothetical protein